MPKFTLTQHAEQRILERKIPNPNSVYFNRGISKKTRKLIRERCKRSGVKKDLVYFVSNKTIVYVCSFVDIGEYIVITAFDLSDGKQ